MYGIWCLLPKIFIAIIVGSNAITRNNTVYLASSNGNILQNHSAISQPDINTGAIHLSHSNFLLYLYSFGHMFVRALLSRRHDGEDTEHSITTRIPRVTRFPPTFLSPSLVPSNHQPVLHLSNSLISKMLYT